MITVIIFHLANGNYDPPVWANPKGKYHPKIFNIFPNGFVSPYLGISLSNPNGIIRF